MADRKKFVILARDGAGSGPLRAQLYAAHRARLDAGDADVTIDASGPLFDPDGSSDTPSGSLLIVSASGIAEVRAFSERDPFYTERVWESVDIHAFDARRWNNSAGKDS
jgi:uncharacterized protein